MEIEEDDGGGGGGAAEMVSPGVSTVAIAVSGGKSGRYALRWALDKFVPGGRVLFRILHVRPPIRMVPTPMGNYIPISQVREDVASAYRDELEWQAKNMLLPLQKMCAQRKVEAEAVLVESDDVPAAISEEIDKFKIRKLVLGSSSKSIFRRKQGSKTATKISECIPSFCTTYVVSKGKLISVRSATSDTGETPESVSSSTISSPSSRSISSSTPSEWGDTYGTGNVSFHRLSLPAQRDHALANLNRRSSPSGSVASEVSYHDDTSLTTSYSMMSEARLSSSISGNSIYMSFQGDGLSDISDLQASVSEIATDLDNSHDQGDLKLEIERLRVKLQHLQNLQEFAHNRSVDATHNPHNLGIRRAAVDKLELKETELTQEMARRLLAHETERPQEQDVAKRQAYQPKQRSSDREDDHPKQRSSDREADEHRSAGEKIVRQCLSEHDRYSWEQIQAATSSFSSDLVIGRGSCGTVYKAKFHHTLAAVKVLNSLEGCGTQQLQQELDVLGKIRHPHLLLMLGGCPEHGCVVYEYMEKGSLDDVLRRRDGGAPPLAWHDRLRIAWEVATAVMFLHSSRPDPVIHRDLKPANILLDRNLVSKVGDVGLSTLLLGPAAAAPSMSTVVRNTAPVGTFCYIDPEYQRTGAVSAKSDVYALGIVILQLLTGRPSPMGLAHAVETALEEEESGGGGGGTSFVDMLDATAGDWPPDEARELAALALRCAEMRRRDRPGLREHVLPVLERMKDLAARASAAAALLRSPAAPPSHFICPILQEVMVDPCVAADGYTYDRKAIEAWVSMKSKSPMTNLRLQSKNLIPNHSLRSAIMDWSSMS